MKLNYLIIPLATIAVALVGGWLTNQGMMMVGGQSWYSGLRLPSWTPAGSFIGVVWTIIFILAALAALIVFNIRSAGRRRQMIMAGFVINAILNIAWSWIFFSRHWLWAAVLEALWLGLSVVALMLMIWPHKETEEEVFSAAQKRSLNRLAALLLLPYAVWVFFATYLTYSIWLLN